MNAGDFGKRTRGNSRRLSLLTRRMPTHFSGLTLFNLGDYTAAEDTSRGHFSWTPSGLLRFTTTSASLPTNQVIWRRRV